MCCDIIRKSIDTEQRSLTQEEAEDLLERACFAQQLEVLPCTRIFIHATMQCAHHS